MKKAAKALVAVKVVEGGFLVSYPDGTEVRAASERGAKVEVGKALVAARDYDFSGLKAA